LPRETSGLVRDQCIIQQVVYISIHCLYIADDSNNTEDNCWLSCMYSIEHLLCIRTYVTVTRWVQGHHLDLISSYVQSDWSTCTFSYEMTSLVSEAVFHRFYMKNMRAPFDAYNITLVIMLWRNDCSYSTVWEWFNSEFCLVFFCFFISNFYKFTCPQPYGYPCMLGLHNYVSIIWGILGMQNHWAYCSSSIFGPIFQHYQRS